MVVEAVQASKLERRRGVQVRSGADLGAETAGWGRLMRKSKSVNVRTTTMRTSLPGWLAVVLSSGSSVCVNTDKSDMAMIAIPFSQGVPREHADKDEGTHLTSTDCSSPSTVTIYIYIVVVQPPGIIDLRSKHKSQKKKIFFEEGRE